MGCDGGTIPKRDELVRTKKKPEQKDKKSEVAFRWKSCALSQEPLQQPIVACELGRMYNKDAILEELLDTTKPNNDMISHLKSIRDVKDLKLTENPSWSEEGAVEKGDGYTDSQTSKWICPVVGQEMSGRLRFVFIWTCGCVLSERAIKQISGKNNTSDKLECLKCLKSFSMDDVILINPVEEEDIQQAQERMEARRERIRNEKKAKKDKKAKAVSSTVTSEANGETSSNHSNDSTSTSSSDKKLNGPIADSRLKGKIIMPGKRSEASSIEEAGASSSKKSRLVLPSSSSSSNSSKKGDVKPKIVDATSIALSKIKGDYSVSTDPKASETYKSLFTTHSKAKNQTKAHWVTFNPFYN